VDWIKVELVKITMANILLTILLVPIKEEDFVAECLFHSAV